MPKYFPRNSMITALFALAFSLVSPSVRAGGWSWKMPPRLVTLDSGRRNPIFYCWRADCLHGRRPGGGFVSGARLLWNAR